MEGRRKGERVKIEEERKRTAECRAARTEKTKAGKKEKRGNGAKKEKRGRYREARQRDEKHRVIEGGTKRGFGGTSRETRSKESDKERRDEWWCIEKEKERIVGDSVGRQAWLVRQSGSRHPRERSGGCLPYSVRTFNVSPPSPPAYLTGVSSIEAVSRRVSYEEYIGPPVRIPSSQTGVSYFLFATPHPPPCFDLCRVRTKFIGGATYQRDRPTIEAAWKESRSCRRKESEEFLPIRPGKNPLERTEDSGGYATLAVEWVLQLAEPSLCPLLFAPVLSFRFDQLFFIGSLARIHNLCRTIDHTSKTRVACIFLLDLCLVSRATDTGENSPIRDEFLFSRGRRWHWFPPPVLSRRPLALPFPTCTHDRNFSALKIERNSSECVLADSRKSTDAYVVCRGCRKFKPKVEERKKEHRVRRRMGGWGGSRYFLNSEHLARKGTQGARFGARNVAGGRRTFVCTVQEGLVDSSRLWRGRDEKRASGGTSFSGTLQRNFTRNSGNLERCWNCRFEAGPDSVQGRRNAARGFKSTITNRGVSRNVEFRYRATKKPPCSLFGSQLHCRLVCNIVVSIREATWLRYLYL